MTIKEPKNVGYVKELAEKMSFECEITSHKESGKTTKDAEKALGINSCLIIKCLLLMSKTGEHIAAIARGCDRVDLKILGRLSGCKDLRFATEEDVQKTLGFEIGGVPALIFQEKGIKTFVDNKVLEQEYVVGSGGTPFHALKFNPRQLITKTGYIPANISKENRNE